MTDDALLAALLPLRHALEAVAAELATLPPRIRRQSAIAHVATAKSRIGRWNAETGDNVALGCDLAVGVMRALLALQEAIEIARGSE